MRSKSMLLLATILIVLMAVGCSSNMEGNSYRQISMEEATAMMAEGDHYILLDVRTEQEYETGHIPGAICIPNEQIGQSPIAQLPDKGQVIFVYCRSGNRSKQAADKLCAQGYTNIYEIGGIIDWHGEVVAGSQP